MDTQSTKVLIGSGGCRRGYFVIARNPDGCRGDVAIFYELAVERRFLAVVCLAASLGMMKKDEKN